MGLALWVVDRLPPWGRRAAAIAVPLLMLAALAATLILAPSPTWAPTRHRPTSTTADVAAPFSPRTSPASAPPRGATSSALAFLRGYLAYSYGHGPARRIPYAEASLLHTLIVEHTTVPPTARSRAPRVTSLQLTAQGPERVQATATVADGSGVAYPILLELVRRGNRWLVARLGDD